MEGWNASLLESVTSIIALSFEPVQAKNMEGANEGDNDFDTVNGSGRDIDDNEKQYREE
jgi:hypothetical protein